MRRLAILLLIISAVSCTSNPPANSSGTGQSETLVSAIDTNASEPAMASAPNGGVYVVYVEHKTGQGADLFLQRFDADAKPVGEKIRINPEPGMVKTWYGDPPTITARPDGSVFAGWTAKDGERGTTLFLSVSRDEGRSFEPPVKVNDDKEPVSHGMHSLTLDTKGNVYMAWLDERNVRHEEKPELADAEARPGSSKANFIKVHHTPEKQEPAAVQKQHDLSSEPNSEVFFAVSTDGGRSFSENKKLATDACPCCKTSLAAAPNGPVFVSWRQVLANGSRHIAVTSLTDGGKSFTSPVIVSDDRWQINACPVSGAAMAIEGNDLLNISWYTAGNAGQPGLYNAVSTDGGKTFGARSLVSDKAVGGTPAMLGLDAGMTSLFAVDSDIEIRLPTGGRQVIENGQYPAAAWGRGKLFVTFVRRENDRRNVVLKVIRPG